MPFLTIIIKLFKYIFFDFFNLISDNVFYFMFFENYLIYKYNIKPWLLIYNILNDYFILSVFIICGVVLSTLLFLLSYFFGLGTVILDAEKTSAYECGFSPIQNARKIIDLRFYKTALMFLVFDIEIIFLLPWSVVLLNNASFNLIYLYQSVPFIFLLFIGILVEFKDRIFDW